MRSDDDLHTPARIRNAAVIRFGQDGFAVGLRAIAVEVGVSPALVLHHFGSKAGLREACDEYVLRTYTELKLDIVGSAGPEHMLAQLAAREEHAPIAAYVVTSLLAGGSFARTLAEGMTDSTEAYLEEGVLTGSIRPSRDPRGRARYLTYSGLGMALLSYRLQADEKGSVDFAAALSSITDAIMVPALELYSSGLFTDSRYLDAYDAATTPDPGEP